LELARELVQHLQTVAAADQASKARWCPWEAIQNAPWKEETRAKYKLLHERLAKGWEETCRSQNPPLPLDAEFTRPRVKLLIQNSGLTVPQQGQAKGVLRTMCEAAGQPWEALNPKDLQPHPVASQKKDHQWVPHDQMQTFFQRVAARGLPKEGQPANQQKMRHGRNWALALEVMYHCGLRAQDLDSFNTRMPQSWVPDPSQKSQAKILKLGPW